MTMNLQSQIKHAKLARSRNFEVKYRKTTQGQNHKEGKEGRKSFYILIFVIFAYMYTLSQG